MSHLPPKSKFAPHEDTLLIESVRVHGTSNWSVVASAVPGRNSRQCRERWTNYVNPELTQPEWTESDDALLVEKFERFGPRWQIITGFFPGRAKNNVRNHFLALQRKVSREKAAESIRPLTNALLEDVAEIEPSTGPASKDPLAFLDTVHQNYVICWQTDQETSCPPDYFFQF
jgi:hypothetical protein